MSKLRRTFKQKFDEKAQAPRIFSGLLGNGFGTVDAGNGKAYVRIAGSVNTAVCSGVPYVNNLPVWVGYTADTPTILRILGQQSTKSNEFIDGVGKHGNQHEWMGAGVGGGTDVVKVHLQQFVPLMVLPYSGLQVQVYPGIAWTGTEYKLVADTNSQGKPIPTIIDLTDYFPSTDKEKYVLIGIDTDGEIEVVDGVVEKDEGGLTLGDVPAATGTMIYKLAAVRRYDGQSSIVVNREVVDIVDLRFPMWRALNYDELIGTLTWDEVDKTISDIADITTKSHTSLTDIGTNSHATIDEFMSHHTHVEDDIIDLSLSFLDLNDTPESYLGNVGKYLRVKADGVEFAEVEGGGGGGGEGGDSEIATADHTWFVDGSLVVAETVGGVLICPRDAIIKNVYIYCEEPGTAGSTIVDIHKNGTTIFTTQSGRPELAYDDIDKVAISDTPDITELLEGDILTLDIDQVADGSSDLTVLLAIDIVVNSISALSAIFTQTGLLSTGGRNQRITNLSGRTLTISKVHLSVGNAPIGSNIIVDVHKNGTTIFTDQNNRPIIFTGENSGYSITVDDNSWGSNDYLTIEIDQVGSSSAGRDLVVTVVCS